jgi:hypothetical protein
MRLVSSPALYGLMLALLVTCGADYAWSSGKVTSHEIDKVSPELQTKIVGLFSHDKCDEIRKIVNPHQIDQFRPNVLAVIAYCEPTGEGWPSSEELFKKAEDAAPTGDLIMVLHAKSVWKKDREASKVLWTKVRMYARNDYFRQMARDHLQDEVNEDKSINLTPFTLFGTLNVGTAYYSNSQLLNMPYLPQKDSAAAILNGKVTYQRWLPFGAIGLNYEGSAQSNITAHEYDQVSNDVDVPFSVHVGDYEDLVFRPIVSYSQVGGRAYRSYFGIGMMGAIFKPEYKQSVEALIYSDHYDAPILSNEDGAHYRFNYRWEFFPPNWYLSVLGAIEHVSADRSASNNGYPGDFNNSHTDLELSAILRRNFPHLTVGLTPKINQRLDSRSSFYNSRIDGSPIEKKRSDVFLSVEPSVIVPIQQSVQIVGWYRLERNFSDMGPEDFFDNNYVNHIFGLTMRLYWSTY